MNRKLRNLLIASFLVSYLIGVGVGINSQGFKSKRLEIQNKELRVALAEGITIIEKLEAELETLNRAMEEFIKEDERTKPENQVGGK